MRLSYHTITVSHHERSMQLRRMCGSGVQQAPIGLEPWVLPACDNAVNPLLAHCCCCCCGCARLCRVSLACGLRHGLKAV